MSTTLNGGHDDPEGMLTLLFQDAENAGYGISSGATFEAYPGMEDAAADYLEHLMDLVWGPDTEGGIEDL